MHYMSPDSSLNKELRNLNHGNYLLDLPIGIRLYVESRLHNKNKKVRNCTSFFRPNGILPANRLTREKVKPILIEKTI
jgi:hypothetical protein